MTSTLQGVETLQRGNSLRLRHSGIWWTDEISCAHKERHWDVDVFESVGRRIHVAWVGPVVDVVLKAFDCSVLIEVISVFGNPGCDGIRLLGPSPVTDVLRSRFANSGFVRLPSVWVHCVNIHLCEFILQVACPLRNAIESKADAVGRGDVETRSVEDGSLDILFEITLVPRHSRKSCNRPL